MNEENRELLPWRFGFCALAAAVFVIVFPVPREWIIFGLLLLGFTMGIVSGAYGQRLRGAILSIGVLCLIPIAFSSCESGRPAFHSWAERARVRSTARLAEINAQTVAKLLPEANKGNANCQYFLAECYLKGRGVEQDEKIAREWLEKAAAQDHAEAKAALAKLLSRAHE